MRWLVAVLALAACDRLLKLDDPHTPAGDASQPPADIGLDAQPACTTVDFADTFEGTDFPCSTWGTVEGPTGWMVRANGQLAIQPTVGAAAFADCYTQLVPFGVAGAYGHVPSVGLNSSYGVIELFTYSSPAEAMNADTTMSFTDSDVAIYDQTTCNSGTCVPIKSVSYVAADMQWFALVPVDGATALAAEYSRDGATWIEIGRRMLPPGETASYAQVTIGGGGDGVTPNPTATRFDSINTCPGLPGS